MSEKDNGGPAFPAPDLGEQDFYQRGAYPGMTMRDYFAAKALPQLLVICQQDDHPGVSYIEHCARLAYVAAAAMLKAREA